MGTAPVHDGLDGLALREIHREMPVLHQMGSAAMSSVHKHVHSAQHEGARDLLDMAHFELEVTTLAVHSAIHNYSPPQLKLGQAQ